MTHRFVADPAVPKDYRGRPYCAECGCPPGGRAHRAPPAPRQQPAGRREQWVLAAAQARDADILGERDG